MVDLHSPESRIASGIRTQAGVITFGLGEVILPLDLFGFTDTQATVAKPLAPDHVTESALDVTVSAFAVFLKRRLCQTFCRVRPLSLCVRQPLAFFCHPRPDKPFLHWRLAFFTNGSVTGSPSIHFVLLRRSRGSAMYLFRACVSRSTSSKVKPSSWYRSASSFGGAT